MREIVNLESMADTYDGFLFDAYGVIFDGKGLIRGAADAWRYLKSRGKGCWVLTNGSSRSINDTVEHYRKIGFELTENELINSASLIAPYFREKGLTGEACAVLGTEGSRAYVRAAGGTVVDPLNSDDYSVVIIANQTEYPLLDTLEAVLSQVITRVEKAQPHHLILTNPDLIYPHAQRRFGLTAGSLALMLEAAFKARLGPDAPLFEKLGKPYPRIYEEAIRRAGSSRLLMIGDQLETDIRGAAAVGLDSVLVGTGLVRTELWKPSDTDPRPNYILHSWRP